MKGQMTDFKFIAVYVLFILLFTYFVGNVSYLKYKEEVSVLRIGEANYSRPEEIMELLQPPQYRAISIPIIGPLVGFFTYFWDNIVYIFRIMFIGVLIPELWWVSTFILTPIIVGIVVIVLKWVRGA